MSSTDTDDALKTQVELRDPDELIPYHNNPKKHPEDQVDKIASSIKNHGWDQPIVTDGDLEIIKGHGRLRAAKKLGLEQVPVIVRDDLTDAQARAARIADNKTQMESGWDADTLAHEFDLLAHDDDLLDATAFDDDELDEYIRGDFSDGDDSGLPEFDPVDDDTRLDEVDGGGDWHADAVECPECGHEFTADDE